MRMAKSMLARLITAIKKRMKNSLKRKKEDVPMLAGSSDRTPVSGFHPHKPDKNECREMDVKK